MPMQDQVLTIPTQDVDESMRVLIASGKFERFGQSDDVLTDKQTGDLVYLVTPAVYDELAQRMEEKELREKQVGIVEVPSVEEAHRVLLEPEQFEACPGSGSAVVDNENGVQIRFVPFRSPTDPHIDTLDSAPKSGSLNISSGGTGMLGQIFNGMSDRILRLVRYPIRRARQLSRAETKLHCLAFSEYCQLLRQRLKADVPVPTIPEETLSDDPKRLRKPVSEHLPTLEDAECARPQDGTNRATGE